MDAHQPLHHESGDVQRTRAGGGRGAAARQRRPDRDGRSVVPFPEPLSTMSEIEESVADLNEEYEILGELGRGGSAIVYHGRDRDLGREVAIKVVRPRYGTSDDDSLQRL